MKDIIASYSDAKRKNERFDLWLYHVGRRFSWPVAWAAINLGVSATTVTFIATGFVWIGAFLIALGNPVWQIAGTLFFQLWIIFDCADGTVARATGTGSKRGEFADAFGGYSVSLLMFTTMGIAGAREVLDLELLSAGFRIAGATGATVQTATVLYAGAILLAGAAGSLFSLYARLLYQKHLNVFEGDKGATRPIKPRDDRSNPLMIAAQNLAANSGFALPLTIVAVTGNLARYYALFYMLVNGGMLVLTVARTLSGKRAPELNIAGPGAGSGT